MRWWTSKKIGLQQQRAYCSKVSADLLTSFGAKQQIENAKHVLVMNSNLSECVSEFTQRGHSVDVLTKKQLSDSNLNDIIGNYDAILADPSLPLDSSLLQHATKLRILGIPDKSGGKIDLMETTRQGVLILSSNETQSFPVEAELTMSLLLCLARNIPQAVSHVRKATQEIDRQEFKGVELDQRTLGIVGLGRVGSSVATLANAVGMEVYAYDPTTADEKVAALGANKCDLETIYEKCDFITFHAPLTKQTRGMYGQKAMEVSKDGVKIIVTSTAGVVDEAAMQQALERGKISGAALDIFEKDPLSSEFKPILQNDAVICTPNIGDSADERVTRRYKEVAEKMCDALAGRRYDGVLNAVFMPLALLPEMQPFLKLAEAIGRLQVQIDDGSIVNVSVATDGGKDVNITTPRAKSLLQAAVLKGIVDGLSSDSDTSVPCSYINSALLAADFDIRSQTGELEGDSNPRGNCITVQVTRSTGERSVIVGSVFGVEGRIVQIGDLRDFPAFKPDGTLLFFNNKDCPGAISGILEILAQSKINVANLGLCRRGELHDAFGILRLDDPVGGETMAALQKLDAIRNVRLAHMNTR